MKEGGGLVGGTCEHCEDRAPSGPRQDSVRTLSGLSGQVREVHKPGSRIHSTIIAHRVARIPKAPRKYISAASGTTSRTSHARCLPVP